MDAVVIEAALAALRGSDSRVLSRESRRYGQLLFEHRIEPRFTIDISVRSASRDPFQLCAQHYWRLRLIQEPTVRAAIECARWVRDHLTADSRIAVEWSLELAAVTKDEVETLSEATAALDSLDDGGLIVFGMTYHANKLRCCLKFEELYTFLADHPVSKTVGSSSPVIAALRAFAAVGNPHASEDAARELVERAWSMPGRAPEATDIVLEALAVGAHFSGSGEIQRDYASEAIASYPGEPIFHYRLACAHRLCGDYDAATASIDTTLLALADTPEREDYMSLRTRVIDQYRAILAARGQACRAAAQRRQFQRLEVSVKAFEVPHRFITAVIVILVAAGVTVAATVGAFDPTTSNAALGTGVWHVVLLGGSLAVFTLVLLGATRFITRARRAHSLRR